MTLFGVLFATILFPIGSVDASMQNREETYSILMIEENEDYKISIIEKDEEIITSKRFSDAKVEAEHQRQLDEGIQKVIEEFKQQYGEEIQIKAVSVEDDVISRNLPHDGRAVLQRSGRAWSPWRYVGTQGFICNGRGLGINVTGGSNVTVSISFAWGAVSVGVSAGAVNNSGVLMTTHSPASHLNRRVRPQLRHEMERREYRIYIQRTPNGAWQFLSNHNTNARRTSDVRQVLRP